MANITLAVTGSISAYKAADLTSQLVKAGHQVRVILTDAAMEFITPLTFQALSKHRVYTNLMLEEDPQSISHIDLAKETDLFLVAPASANTLAKMAHGFADDMVAATALALPPHVKKVIAPAMNTQMYLHPATQQSIQQLKRYGYHEISPREALLACGDYGIGALADIQEILEKVSSYIQ